MNAENSYSSEEDVKKTLDQARETAKAECSGIIRDVIHEEFPDGIDKLPPEALKVIEQTIEEEVKGLGMKNISLKDIMSEQNAPIKLRHNIEDNNNQTRTPSRARTTETAQNSDLVAPSRQAQNQNVDETGSVASQQPQFQQPAQPVPSHGGTQSEPASGGEGGGQANREEGAFLPSEDEGQQGDQGKMPAAVNIEKQNQKEGSELSPQQWNDAYRRNMEDRKNKKYASEGKQDASGQTFDEREKLAMPGIPDTSILGGVRRGLEDKFKDHDIDTKDKPGEEADKKKKEEEKKSQSPGKINRQLAKAKKYAKDSKAGKAAKSVRDKAKHYAGAPKRQYEAAKNRAKEAYDKSTLGKGISSIKGAVGGAKDAYKEAKKAVKDRVKNTAGIRHALAAKKRVDAVRKKIGNAIAKAKRVANAIINPMQTLKQVITTWIVDGLFALITGLDISPTVALRLVLGNILKFKKIPIKGGAIVPLGTWELICLTANLAIYFFVVGMILLVILVIIVMIAAALASTMTMLKEGWKFLIGVI